MNRLSLMKEAGPGIEDEKMGRKCFHLMGWTEEEGKREMDTDFGNVKGKQENWEGRLGNNTNIAR